MQAYKVSYTVLNPEQYQPVAASVPNLILANDFHEAVDTARTFEGHILSLRTLDLVSDNQVAIAATLRSPVDTIENVEPSGEVESGETNGN